MVDNNGTGTGTRQDFSGIDQLTAIAADEMMKASIEWMRKNSVEFSDGNIAKVLTVLRANASKTIDEANHDAKEALDAGMDRIATTTFIASFVVAGTRAAREAFPEVA